MRGRQETLLARRLKHCGELLAPSTLGMASGSKVEAFAFMSCHRPEVLHYYKATPAIRWLTGRMGSGLTERDGSFLKAIAGAPAKLHLLLANKGYSSPLPLPRLVDSLTPP